MSNKKRGFQGGIRIKPNTSGVTDDGDITVDSADNKLKAKLDGASRSVVTEDQTQTVTNKTIDSANNTITVDADEATVENLEVDNLKAGVLNTDSSFAGATDAQIPSALAVKNALDAQDDASEITYTPLDNTDWNGDVDPGNVDSALDQLAERENDHAAATAGVHGVTGNVVGDIDTQTLTNKTITDDSNTIKVKDGVTGFDIHNAADGTKKIEFDVSGSTTGVTTTLAPSSTANQTIQLPNVSGADTLVAEDTGQILTNKTIDSVNNTLTIDADEATVENIEVDNFKASAIVTEAEGIAGNDNDTTLPTSAAVKDYADTQSSERATRELDNLTTTSINADLLPDNTQPIDPTLGDATNPWNEISGRQIDVYDGSDTFRGRIKPNVAAGNALEVEGSDGVRVKSSNATGATDGVTITTGDTVTAGDTGDVFIATGTTVSGASGDVLISTGNATTTKGDIVLNGNQVSASNTKIVNVADPTAAQDAATKAYVDSQVQSKDDASEITYTPSDVTDWNGDADPGNTNAALDQLAERENDHSAATSNVHGVTGNVVGTSDTQTLTNKTIDSDSNTISNLRNAELAADADITRTKLAPGTANHVLINDGTGEISSEAQLSKARGGTGADNSSVTFPTTGTIVTEAGAQTLTNKSIQSPSRLDPKKDTEANLITYAASAQNGELVYATDTKKFYVVTDGALTEVGGAGAGGTSIEINETAHGFAVGDGIYHDGTNWLEAQADDGTTLAQFVVTEVVDVDNVVAYQFGQVTITSHGFTVGEYYFLDATVAGTPTATEPSSGFSCPLFYVLDANTLIINVYRPSSIGVSGSAAGSGDADTIHLIRANSDDIDVITQFSVDSTLPNFDGTTAFGVNEGDISVPTSGSEALLSNENDHKVYKFTSESASQYSAFGMNLAISRYVRGKDVVLQFKYRTADTSGDSQNADYMPWVYDQTSGVNTTFNDTPGTFTAGSSIVLTTTAGMAVGDKIWVGEAAGVVETHITAIPVAGTVQLADEVTCAAGARFITGILTDVLTTLDAADDDTDKTGTDYKVVFRVPSTCAEVTVMFQQLTSETDSFLYVDNILISSEVVKRVFAKDKPITVRAEGNGGTSITDAVTDIDFTEVFDSDNAWNGTGFTAPRTGYYSVEGGVQTTAATNARVMAYVDGTLSKFLSAADLNTNVLHFSGILYLQKGEEFTCRINSTNTLSNSSSAHYIVITETAQQVNDVVVVESTDSVISEWTDFTPTGLWTTNTTYTGKWRRVGDTMQVSVNASLSGAPNAGNMYFDLPSGYVIDTSKLPDTTVGIGFLGSGTAHDSGTGSETIEIRYKDTTSVYAATYDGSSYIGATVPFTWTSADDLNAYFEVPIAGWDANPKPLLALPTVTYGQEPEEYIAYGGGDEASANTALPYWTTVNKDTTGNSVSITNDSTNGFLLTALQRVKVSLSGVVYDASDNTIKLVVVKNHDDYTESESSVRTNHPDRVIDYAIDLGDGTASPRNNSFSSVPFILDAGDIISIHSEKTLEAEADNRIRVFAEPIHGQVNQAAIISQPVAFVEDRKTAGTHGGTSSITVATRDLNTLSGDIAAVGVTLSSNQFTLPAGKFYIEWDSQFYRGDYVATEIYNITDSKQESLSVNMYSNGADSQAHYSSGSCVLTITKSTTFELRYEVATSQAGTGLGLASGSGGGALSIVGYEKYSQVKITRKK